MLRNMELRAGGRGAVWEVGPAGPRKACVAGVRRRRRARADGLGRAAGPARARLDGGGRVAAFFSCLFEGVAESRPARIWGGGE